MANTTNPSLSTYDTKRISLVASPEHRSGSSPTQDAHMVNAMIEAIDVPLSGNKKIFVKSRPGLLFSHNTTSGVGRGIHYWSYGGLDYVLSVVGSSVYVNSTFLFSLVTSTGDVGFTTHVSSTAAITVVMLDGIRGYVFTSPTVVPTQITSANFPTPHVPIPIFLDGYIFVAKSGTQDIYNSNLDFPLLWTAGDFISAEMYPDNIVALSKNNNYLYAIGVNSVEYFSDIGNATASPLGRHAAAVQQFGTPASATVVQTEKEVILVGATGNGGNTVWTIDGFKETEIGNPSIKSILLFEGINLQNASAYSIRVASQKLYVLVLSTRTLVYSFDTQMWSEWASGTNNSTVRFIGTHSADGPYGHAFVQDTSNGKVYTMLENSFTDDGAPFTCEIVTAKQDFGTISRKTASRLSIIGDVPDRIDVDNNVSIEWSDDDYRTWSTPRTLTFNYDFPVITQLGGFRRRAFRIRYSLPHLFRIEGLEIDINKGTQ